MYKSRLQELCQQKQWELPKYSTSREGPDHQPRFKGSVLVNGNSFDSPDFCKSSKEAQSEAARIAFQHFISPSSPPVVVSTSSSSTGLSSADTIMQNSPNGEGNILRKKEELSHNSSSHGIASIVKDDKDFGDLLYLCKGQLQIYAQKRNLSLPVYSCIREGSSHAPRFKAVVTVGGQSFESPEFCRTLKEAEHAAAKVAFSSLSKDGIQEDDCALYKNHLQELARKEGFSIPNYMTTLSGASHVPTFTSTVEVGGDVFHGVAARTKKQAELNAAKVAYVSLKERQSRKMPSLTHSGDSQGSLENIFSSLDSGITVVPAPLCDSGDAKVSLENVFSSSHSGITAVPATPSHSGNAHVSLENAFSSSHSLITNVPATQSHSGDSQISLEKAFSSSRSGINVVPAPLSNSGNVQVSVKNAFSSSQSDVTGVPAPLSHSSDAQVSLENAFSGSHSGITFVPAPLSNSGDAQVSLEKVFSSSHSGITVVPAPLSHGDDAQGSLGNASSSHSSITVVPTPLFHVDDAQGSLENASSSHSGITVVPAPLSHSDDAQVSLEKIFSSSHSGITDVPAPPSYSDGVQGSLANVSSHSSITVDFQRKLNLGDTDQMVPSDEVITRKGKDSADHSTSLLNPGSNSDPRIKDTSPPDVIYEHLQVPVPSIPSPEFGRSSPTTVLEGSDFSLTELNRDLLAQEGSLLCNRVMVYPRKPNKEFPKGTTLLPITDDHWVAVNLEYPNE